MEAEVQPFAGASERPIPDSKFGSPTLAARAFARPRLSEAFADDDWRVGLVTGGPATGKTVFTAQWFNGLEGVAREWVTLDAHDDRPERFWLTFATAWERAVPGAFARTLAAADVHRLAPEFIEHLVLDLSTLDGAVVVVLDDAHHLSNPSICDDLAVVVEHLPRGSRIVLTSRVEPRLPIGRWRGRSWLAELRQRDLAFTLPETTTLLDALGERRLNDGDVKKLWLHTEGWVAALRLAVIALRDCRDVSAAVAEFSGRNALVADLLADEILHRGPPERTEFLLRTSIVDVVDAELCDALTGRTDSGELLRIMEAELQFVTAMGPDRATYRYHPLLAEMMRSELVRRRPHDVQALNRLAASILEERGDLPGALRCLLAAGDVDRAFSLVFVAAYRRHDLGDIAGVAAFVNLFPMELVAQTPSRMLTYALMLGLCSRAAEALPWLERAALRLADDPERSATDLAIIDALRLMSFTVTGELDDQIQAGCRAVAAIEEGLDLGIVGARTRMNLVRGYLLVDDPHEADRVRCAGQPGDEIAALLLAPALGARIALREGRLTDAQRQARTALIAADAFGMDNHFGAIDAHLAAIGVLIDRNEIAEAGVAIERLESSVVRNRQVGPHHVLLQLDKVRVAAARDEFDDAFRLLRELSKIIGPGSVSVVRYLVDAVTARCWLETGETSPARELIDGLPRDGVAHTLLRARLELACGRPDDAADFVSQRQFETLRDQLSAELLQARCSIDLAIPTDTHLTRIVELAAPERLVRMVLDEGAVMIRLVRSAAESSRTESGVAYAVALGMPPRTGQSAHQSTLDFTEREQSVLRFLPSRLTNAEIGRECLMSVNTVKTHLKSIYAKLGVASRSEAVTRARLLGLL